VRNYRKQGKKNEFKINNTKKKEKRAELFEKQLKLFRMSINQVKKVVGEVIAGADWGALSIIAELKGYCRRWKRFMTSVIGMSFWERVFQTARRCFRSMRSIPILLSRGRERLLLGTR